MDKIEKAIEALRAAIAEEVASAEARGRMLAKTEAMEAVANAMGVSLPRKPGRKPKA